MTPEWREVSESEFRAEAARHPLHQREVHRIGDPPFEEWTDHTTGEAFGQVVAPYNPAVDKWRYLVRTPSPRDAP